MYRLSLGDSMCSYCRPAPVGVALLSCTGDTEIILCGAALSCAKLWRAQSMLHKAAVMIAGFMRYNGWSEH